MKKEIHPEYRDVIFKDNASGAEFVIGSTIKADKEVTHKGKKYPMVEIEISSVSHPFYTGAEKVLDTAGRVERFKARASKSRRASA